MPGEGLDLGANTSLSPQAAIFLNHNLPAEQRRKWRPLFNSRTQGESFSKLSAAIVKKGPTLVVVWEKKGNVFGGYASDSWALGPKFYGDNSCFLFTLTPKMFAYEALRFNSNYQYMNLKQKTMPNGIGKQTRSSFLSLLLFAVTQVF